MYPCLKSNDASIQNKVELKTQKCSFGAPCKWKELGQKATDSIEGVV